MGHNRWSVHRVSQTSIRPYENSGNKTVTSSHMRVLMCVCHSYSFLLQPYVMIGQDESRLFCNGYYAEILIISSQTLEILFTLTSRLNPDWITAMHVIRPPKRQGVYLLFTCHVNMSHISY